MKDSKCFKESCNWLGGLCLVLISFALQGCPHSYLGKFDPSRMAWIYAPADSTYVRTYNREVDPIKEEQILVSDKNGAFIQVAWYCPETYNTHTSYNEEYHNLHIRRMTEKGVCYVVLGAAVKINGITHFWVIREGDSLKVEDSFYSLTQVIDSIRTQCPNRFFSITGKEEQSIYSPLSMSSYDYPSITIK